MTTPIADFVRAYAASGRARLHMPGHKGAPILGCEALDITEVQGADALYECTGIIARSEANAAALFGTGATLYSTEGSSHAIRAMVFLAWQHRPAGREHILAARNAHRAFLYACALVGCEVDWLYPDTEDGRSLCACQVTPAGVERALSALGELPFALYLTSPDYLGNMADLPAIAAVCRRYGVPVLVDDAHGAYLHFLPGAPHPIDQGAWMCADSAHKTLPVLTGGAYLHLSAAAARAVGGEGKAALAMTGSTSPSYLILQSLDLCNRALAEGYAAALGECAARLDALKAALGRRGIPTLPGERLKLTVDAAAMGHTGADLGELLRGEGIEPEFADEDHLVCMLAPSGPWEEDMDRLGRALLKAPVGAPRPRRPLYARPLERAMSIREAVFARHETVPLARAVGRVCGQPTVSCPPAIPIAVSGEVISAEILPVFAAYGQGEISVVAQ